MTVYHCDLCGRRVYRDDAEMHIITISDKKAHREIERDICKDCIDKFWENLPSYVKMEVNE